MACGRDFSPYDAGMEQRISLITLGVDDVARSKAFYEALGWSGQEVEETVFFQAGGLAVVLWGRAKLADDANVAPTPSSCGFNGVALAHNVRSPQEVDEIIATAERRGATVTQPARRTSYGGYAGYFADPDGHLWEVAHNPGFTLADDGTLRLPDFGDVAVRMIAPSAGLRTQRRVRPAFSVRNSPPRPARRRSPPSFRVEPAQLSG